MERSEPVGALGLNACASCAACAPSTTVRSLRELQWSPSPASRGRKKDSPPIISQHHARPAGGDEFVAKLFQIGAIVVGDADVVAQRAAKPDAAAAHYDRL